jgi:hypothetical protein
MGQNPDQVPRTSPATVLDSTQLQEFVRLGRGEVVSRSLLPAAVLLDQIADAMDAAETGRLRLVQGGES